MSSTHRLSALSWTTRLSALSWTTQRLSAQSWKTRLSALSWTTQRLSALSSTHRLSALFWTTHLSTLSWTTHLSACPKQHVSQDCPQQRSVSQPRQQNVSQHCPGLSALSTQRLSAPSWSTPSLSTVLSNTTSLSTVLNNTTSLSTVLSNTTSLSTVLNNTTYLSRVLHEFSANPLRADKQMYEVALCLNHIVKCIAGAGTKLHTLHILSLDADVWLGLRCSLLRRKRNTAPRPWTSGPQSRSWYHAEGKFLLPVWKQTLCVTLRTLLSRLIMIRYSKHLLNNSSQQTDVKNEPYFNKQLYIVKQRQTYAKSVAFKRLAFLHHIFLGPRSKVSPETSFRCWTVCRILMRQMSGHWNQTSVASVCFLYHSNPHNDST